MYIGTKIVGKQYDYTAKIYSTIPKIPYISSQKRNCSATVPISTFMFLSVN